MSSDRLDNQKRRNTLIGTSLMIAAAVMIGFGYKLFMDRPAGLEVDFKVEAQERCLGRVQSFGLAYEIYGSNITFSASGDQHSSKDILAWSSMIIQQCDGYSVKTYCVGDACGKGYFSMVLEYRDAHRNGGV